MLYSDLFVRAVKWAGAAQPFIDSDSQSILIAGRARLAPCLLRGHIRNGARFLTELVNPVAAEACIEHLNGGQRIEVDMFAKIDSREPAASKQPEQAIVAKLLSRAVCHVSCSFLATSLQIGIAYIDSNCMDWLLVCQGKRTSEEASEPGVLSRGV